MSGTGIEDGIDAVDARFISGVYTRGLGASTSATSSV